MFKKQLDCLMAVLNYCYELSGNSDSLTNINDNKVFAGYSLNDNGLELIIFTNNDNSLESDERGVAIVVINLDSNSEDAIQLVDSTLDTIRNEM